MGKPGVVINLMAGADEMKRCSEVEAALFTAGRFKPFPMDMAEGVAAVKANLHRTATSAP